MTNQLHRATTLHGSLASIRRWRRFKNTTHSLLTTCRHVSLSFSSFIRFIFFSSMRDHENLSSLSRKTNRAGLHPPPASSCKTPDLCRFLSHSRVSPFSSPRTSTSLSSPGALRSYLIVMKWTVCIDIEIVSTKVTRRRGGRGRRDSCRSHTRSVSSRG